MPKKYNTAEERLARIAGIIEDVDNRCAAADGPVTPTLQEMTQAEISEIYELASTGPVGLTERMNADVGRQRREEVRKLKRRYQIVRSELKIQLKMWEDVKAGKRAGEKHVADPSKTARVAKDYCDSAIRNGEAALKQASKVR